MYYCCCYYYYYYYYLIGGFCGEVLVDSDIDDALTERAKAAATLAHDRRGVVNMEEIWNRRQSFQKQFVQQIQGAFQHIKVRTALFFEYSYSLVSFLCCYMFFYFWCFSFGG